MRTMIIASAFLAIGLAGPAMAKGAEDRCAPSAEARNIPSSEVSKGLEDLGYRVDRIKAEHGFYEVVAVNDSGLPIKVRYSKSTGELLGARLR